MFYFVSMRTFYTDSSGKGLFFFFFWWGGCPGLFMFTVTGLLGLCLQEMNCILYHCLHLRIWDYLHLPLLLSPRHMLFHIHIHSVMSHSLNKKHVWKMGNKGWIEFCRYAQRRQISFFPHLGGICGKHLPWYFPSYFCGNKMGLIATLCLYITSCMQYHIYLQLYGRRFYLPQQA